MLRKQESNSTAGASTRNEIKVNDCIQDHSMKMFEAIFIAIVRFPSCQRLPDILNRYVFDVDLTFSMSQG